MAGGREDGKINMNFKDLFYILCPAKECTYLFLFPPALFKFLVIFSLCTDIYFLFFTYEFLGLCKNLK